MDPLRADQSRVESELRAAFGRATSVSAVFVDRDEDGCVVVFAVVPEHDDSSYSEVIAAEEQVRTRLPDQRFETHVRAHQGRPSRAAVPPGAVEIFVR